MLWNCKKKTWDNNNKVIEPHVWSLRLSFVSETHFNLFALKSIMSNPEEAEARKSSLDGKRNKP